jgi:pimeloyl-ACP methyl ester carboxylesterase
VSVALVVVSVALVVVSVALVLAATLGIILGRRVVVDRPRRELPVIAVTSLTVTLPRTPLTAAPGTYSLYFNQNRDHALLGAVLERSERSIERELLRSTGPLSDVSSVIWSGQIVADPHELGDYENVEITSSHGTVHAWHVSPGVTVTPITWAIHIHGLRSSREGALRTVPVATELGMHSLVIAFADAHTAEGTRPVATLGVRESEDVGAAIGYALAHGAHRVVLFGFSMGASAALLAAERSPLRDHICALILVGPATNWREIIRHAARQAHLTAAAGSLACLVLKNTTLSRLACTPIALDFDQLDWTSRPRVTTPTLVLHSSGDTEVPLRLSEEFTIAQHPHAHLRILPAAPHCAEYNVDPDLFNRTITKWWRDGPG